MLFISLLFSVVTMGMNCLDNGLARTPPMGWMSWERYRCNIDCENYPNDCISEDLYIRMADLLVNNGYTKYGYEYLSVDDCWAEHTRDENDTLVPDRKRFPHGIKWLADYVHSKGLKLGIYNDVGSLTCELYPGSDVYLEKDAQTFAAWGVDMVKVDGCNTNLTDLANRYTDMGTYLNQTGRPMLYSCSWPAYMVFKNETPDYEVIADTCNAWRNYRDIVDTWNSVRKIIDFYGNDTGNFSEVAGPGHFNDPDMLIIGNYGLSYDQQRVQMVMWAILAAPLLISADLANIPPKSVALLQNLNIIRINQDPAGIQGKRIVKETDIEVWTKPIGENQKELAFAFLNLATGGFPFHVNITLYDLGLREDRAYTVTEGLTGKVIGTLTSHQVVNATVNPSGIWLGIAKYLHLGPIQPGIVG